MMKKIENCGKFLCERAENVNEQIFVFADDYQSKFSMYIYFLCTHFRKSVDDRNSGSSCFKITFCNASKMHTQKY